MPPKTVWIDDPGIAVRLNRQRRARRFTLRLETGGDGAVLTLPPQVCETDARAFLLRHRGWLARALSDRPAPVTVAPGVSLPVDGVAVPVVAEVCRGVRLDGGRLAVPRGRAPGPAVAAWLKARARDRLAPLAEAHAGRLGRRIAGVSLRDTRSRWGSCSSAGRLSFSWRIAMAPPEVQDYLAAHEAAHLVEMNHSARFWALVERLMPGHERPRAWLKRDGRGLHRYRFDTGD